MSDGKTVWYTENYTYGENSKLINLVEAEYGSNDATDVVAQGYDKDGTEKDSWMKIFSKDGQRIEKF